MAKVITFNVPTKGKNSSGEVRLEQRKGNLVKLWVGDVQEKFVLQHDNAGKADCLVHYASGCRLPGSLKPTSMYLYGKEPSPRDRAVDIIAQLIENYGLERVQNEMRKNPVINPKPESAEHAPPEDTRESPPTGINNLAQFKLALQVGSTWKCRFLVGRLQGQEHIRKVQILQSNAVQFEPLPGHTEGSWLYFGKASEYEFLPTKVVVKDTTGSPLLEYRPLIAVGETA